MPTIGRALRTGACLAALALIGSGCAFTPPEKAAQIVQPKTAPVRNITSFSESLRCMDDLYASFGVNNIIVTSQGIPDATGEISTGTKDMMISAISRMSVKSGAFVFVDFDQTQFDINALQNLVGFTDDFLVPNYYIRGAITQLDEQVLSESQSGGVSLPFVDAGASRDQVISLVSIDLNMGNLLTRQILSGTSATNTIVVRRAGKSADAGATIENIQLGVNFNISFNQSEGMHQAIRTLVDLSLIETLGKLTRVPYWRCLQIGQTNPAVTTQAADWYEVMEDGERVMFVQRSLSGLGYLQTLPTGVLDSSTREAIGVYQSENGLLANGRIDFNLYRSLIGGDLALGKQPAPDTAAAPRYTPAAGEPVIPATAQVLPQTAPPPPPLTLSVTTPLGPTPTYSAGDTLSLAMSSNRDAFAYCYYQDATGTIARIFPNRFQPDALIPAGGQVTVPGREARFQILFENPGATEQVVCMASDVELGISLPDALKVEDLTPLPVQSLAEIAEAFRVAGQGNVTQAVLPITVAN